ncbi:MAG: LysR family transcriptional regulator [Desulfosporosinus sp.]|nr:LysR family transcriptional regulator [Desulfosporosinus sp.]
MLDLMRLFAQVVEEQSFTMVARKLGISQPAVSNQIRAFEEKLGVKLLYRKGKGFALTPEGRQFTDIPCICLMNGQSLCERLVIRKN